MTDTHEPTDAPVLSTGDDAAHWSDEQYLVAFLSQRERLCPLCRYNLRGVTRPNCPECGHSLKLDVRMAEPYLAAWIVCVAMLCMAAGPGLFAVLVTVYKGSLLWGSMTSLEMVFCVYGLVTILGVTLVVGLRRRFCQLPHEVQWVIVAAPVSANATILLILVAAILSR